MRHLRQTVWYTFLIAVLSSFSTSQLLAQRGRGPGGAGRGPSGTGGMDLAARGMSNSMRGNCSNESGFAQNGAGSMFGMSNSSGTNSLQGQQTLMVMQRQMMAMQQQIVRLQQQNATLIAQLHRVGQQLPNQQLAAADPPGLTQFVKAPVLSQRAPAQAALPSGVSSPPARANP